MKMSGSVETISKYQSIFHSAITHLILDAAADYCRVQAWIQLWPRKLMVDVRE